MVKKTLFLTLAFVFVPLALVLAGTDFAMKCKNCGYASRVKVGGGMRFEQITGYCTNCQKFVYVTWDRKQKTSKPNPTAKVWDSATGAVVELYPCPHCSKTFLPLRKKSGGGGLNPGFDNCPKCGKATFEVDKKAGIMMYD